MPRSSRTGAPCSEARSEDARRARIRELNDAFRLSFLGGRFMLTNGVLELGAELVEQTVQAVRAFTAFSRDNDSYDEHDFGAVEVSGHRIFWKIDYYDHRYDYGSPDPSLPGLTGRLLIIMLASEY